MLMSRAASLEHASPGSVGTGRKCCVSHGNGVTVLGYKAHEDTQLPKKERGVGEGHWEGEQRQEGDFLLFLELFPCAVLFPLFVWISSLILTPPCESGCYYRRGN